jgi:hypothetical protein
MVDEDDVVDDVARHFVKRVLERLRGVVCRHYNDDFLSAKCHATMSHLFVPRATCCCAWMALD